MVQARTEFLAAGHFSGVASELALAVHDALAPLDVDGCIVDAGAGTGYYLAAVLDRLPARVGLALDLSKAALRRAARAHPRIGAVACDVWRQYPVADGAAVAVLDVFAPRNGEEVARVLHPAGTLFVVTPTPDHLAELRSPLGLLSVDERQDERLAEKQGPHLSLVSRRRYRSRLALRRPDVRAIAGMGPSAWHLDRADLEARIGVLPEPSRVTVSVTVSTFRRSGA